MISILDRYILRQLIVVTVLGVLSLTALLLLGQIFQELQSLLVESGAPASIVLEFMVQVIPFSLTFSVPWGFLTAVLLVYGRLAADNELTSMRMAGLSLWRLSMPAIVLGLAFSALCYYINIEVAPRGKQAMSDLVIKAAHTDPKKLLSANQTAIKIGDGRLYLEKRVEDTIYGLHVYPDGAKDMGFASMHAQRAEIGDFDRETRQIELTLYDVTIERRDEKTSDLSLINKMPLKIDVPLNQQRRLKDNRFTNEEIAEALANFYAIEDIDLPLMQKLAKQASLQNSFPAAASLWSTALNDVTYYKRGMSKKVERAFQTEPTKRASFAVSCIIFSLIGVPLAITARRRDTSTGFALGILVAALYFMALVLCEISRKSSGWIPYVVLWLPNVLGIIYALYLHARARYRG